MRRLSFALFFLVLAGVAGTSAAKTPPPPDDPGVFSETLDVQAVNVQVVVTDRKGERVPGLTADDFRLVVDGKPISLDYFLEVRDGRVVGGVPGAATADLPQGLSDVSAGEEVGNSYLVFIDELFSPVFLRNEAIKSVARELDTLRPQDRMAIVTYDGRKLRVLSDWSNSTEELRGLLDEAGKQKGSIATAAIGLDRSDQDTYRLLGNFDRLYPGAHGLDASAAMGFEQATRRELELVERVVSAATAAQRAFSVAPGRKVMLLISGGWQFDRYSTYAFLGGSPFSSMDLLQTDGIGLLRPLTDTGNLLGYTVYPLHLASVTRMVPSAADPTYPLQELTQLRANESLSQMMTRNSLAFAAEQTGGRLLMPGRDSALARIEADTRSYYWLGFTHSGGDDKRRNVKVETARPGLELRARSNFVPLSSKAKAAMEVESALYTGKTEGMGTLNVTPGKLRKAGWRTAELPLALEIPSDQVSMIEQDGRYVARLELRVAALDVDGSQSDIPVVPIDISGDAALTPGGTVPYKTTVKVRNIEQDLQLVLLDVLTGKAVTARVHVKP